MTQDKRTNETKRSDVHKKNEQNVQHSSKENTNSQTFADIPSKVVIRRLPPSLTAESFLQHVSPVPDYDYFHFAEAELGLGPNAFTRAYINFVNPKDIWIFQEKFDGYVFLDDKGNEYPAVVEFAPYPRVSKKKNKRPDPRKGTIEQDPDYLKFLDKLNNADNETIPPPESLLEEIEAKEKLLKANHGCPKMTTPLIEYLTKRKEDKRNAFAHAREEKRRKEIEKRKQLEDERRKKLEKDRRELMRQKQKEKEEKKKDESASASFRVQLLRNPEREKEKDRKDSQTAAMETESKEMPTNRIEADGERAKFKELDRKNLEASDRQADDRRDGKDKAKKQEKTFAERRKEGESSTKDSNYSARKRTDTYGDHGHRQGERERIKERTKDGDLAEKDLVWERDGGARSGGYHGYNKHRESDSHRDGKREAKSDYKFDSQRQKELAKISAKDAQYSKESSYDYRGSRRYHPEPRGRNKGGGYDGRRDSGNYDSWKEGDGKGHGGYQHGRESGVDKLPAKTKEEKASFEGVDHGEKDSSGKQFDEKPRDSSDSAGNPKSVLPKTHVTKTANDEEAYSSSSRIDEGEFCGKGSSDKDASGANSRQKVRYKDRPERAIYNPAKRAVERQKEAGSSR